MFNQILRVILISSLCLSVVAMAEGPTRYELLDQHFATLKQAKDEVSAREIEQKIWKLWTASENAQVNELMKQVLEARRWGDYEKSLSLIDQVTEIDPAYAEAWNQRATVHFLQGKYERALEDVATTLVLEPRHFGAMAGRGVIRLRQGKSALAIQNIKAAMVYHPFLRERTLVPPQFLNQPDTFHQESDVEEKSH